MDQRRQSPSHSILVGERRRGRGEGKGEKGDNTAHSSDRQVKIHNTPVFRCHKCYQNCFCFAGTIRLFPLTATLVPALHPEQTLAAFLKNKITGCLISCGFPAMLATVVSPRSVDVGVLKIKILRTYSGRESNREAGSRGAAMWRRLYRTDRNFVTLSIVGLVLFFSN